MSDMGDINDTIEWVVGLIQQVAPADRAFAGALTTALENYVAQKDMTALPLLLQLRNYPVGIEEFLFSKRYLGRPENSIYPEVLKELVAINNPGGARAVNPYVEAVLTGSIGSAKTTVALYTQAYQLYVTSCFTNPHEAFNLDPSSEILFIFQSMGGVTAESIYRRFREICEQSYYFTYDFPFRKRLKSKLIFPNRLECLPVGSDSGTIGLNVMSGLIDEVNFMHVIKNSARAIDKGTYDQAQVIYNGIARRRKSRFLEQGKQPGILCLVSSKRYPGEFTDQKMAEAKTNDTIYVYDKRSWDIKPGNPFARGSFYVFAGDETRKPRILSTEKDRRDVEPELVHRIPIDYLTEFENDMQGSLRDVAGVSTLARYPFIFNTEAINAAFNKNLSVLSRGSADFVGTKVAVLSKRIVNPEEPRWVHCDLALAKDSAGVAIGHVDSFKAIKQESGVEEYMPNIYIDGLLEIRPPKQDEIQLHKVRDLIYLLIKLGVNVKWVSFDSYESADSIQLLRNKGLVAGRFSVDTTNTPYNMLKTAAYDGRIKAPEHSLCLRELVQLEKDPMTGKIDHPPTGSKDVADAMASVIYGLTTRRELWTRYKIPLNAAVKATAENEAQQRRFNAQAERQAEREEGKASKRDLSKQEKIV